MNMKWVGGVLTAMALLSSTGAMAAEKAAAGVIAPEALFEVIGQKPTRGYKVDDGKGWRFSTPGKDVWDEEKQDPEAGPRFSVEYRGKPLSHINLALQQFNDDPEQQANNTKVGQLFTRALEAITGSSEVIGQLESGKISGKMAGYVNGYRITASPASDGARFVTITKE